VQLQRSKLAAYMRVDEAMQLCSCFYPNPVDWRQLIGTLGLDGKRATR
jgi:ABC-2 type transport system ATP-binding protein